MTTNDTPAKGYGLIKFNLADHLPTHSLAQAAPYFWLSFAASWLVCYLVHLQSDTRLLRRALWPVAVAANLWTVLTVDLRGEFGGWTIVGLLWFNNTSAAIRWGRATAPPTYHPLPRRPLLALIRNTSAFRALNLMFDEARLLSVVGHSPPPTRFSHGPLYHICRHLIYGTIEYILFDLWTYPLYHLDPFNIGYPLAQSADWSQGIATICVKTGLPEVLVIPGVVLGLSAGIYHSMGFTWQMVAIAGICSGLWTAEEWPEFMDRPWVSSSLNELWGRRYHQLLRHGFQNYALPLSSLPPYLHIMRIFLMSAIYHMLVYHAVSQSFLAIDMSLMFLLTGLGLEAERQIWHRTGKRVGGWKGRVWMWSWFLFCGYFIARGLAEIGMMGRLRVGFAEDRRASAVEWVGYLCGWRPHPALPLPVEALIASN